MAKTETLTCIECGSQWEREARGGRKPGFCSEDCCKETRRKSSKKWREKNQEYQKEYYEKNKERLYREDRKRVTANPEKYRSYQKDYRQRNRERLIEKDRQHYQENKEKILAQQKRYRERNADRIREYSKEHYRNNPDKAKARARLHYRENRQEKLEYQKRYATENQDVVTASRLRYETRKMSAWKEDVMKDDLLERDGWKCHICKGEIPKGLDWEHPLFPHIEHIVPLSKGGENSYENTAPAHASCNLQKGDLLDGWQGIKPIVRGEVA